MNTWQLQTAKARLSELVKMAVSQGPQVITVRGGEEVVVLSKDAFDRMTKPKPSFVKFIRQSPLVGTNLDLERDESLNRKDVEL